MIQSGISYSDFLPKEIDKWFINLEEISPYPTAKKCNNLIIKTNHHANTVSTVQIGLLLW